MPIKAIFYPNVKPLPTDIALKLALASSFCLSILKVQYERRASELSSYIITWLAIWWTLIVLCHAVKKEDIVIERRTIKWESRIIADLNFTWIDQGCLCQSINVHGNKSASWISFFLFFFFFSSLRGKSSKCVFPLKSITIIKYWQRLPFIYVRRYDS